jgi:hypothetical protein
LKVLNNKMRLTINFGDVSLSTSKFDLPMVEPRNYLLCQRLISNQLHLGQATSVCKSLKRVLVDGYFFEPGQSEIASRNGYFFLGEEYHAIEGHSGNYRIDITPQNFDARQPRIITNQTLFDKIFKELTRLKTESRY